MPKLNEAETLRQLEEAERRYWDEVDKILTKRVQPLVEAYCRKYGRRFISGNGDWYFDNPAVERRETTWRRGEQVSFSNLEHLLDSPASRSNCIGSLLGNYPTRPPGIGEAT